MYDFQNASITIKNYIYFKLTMHYKAGILDIEVPNKEARNYHRIIKIVKSP